MAAIRELCTSDVFDRAVISDEAIRSRRNDEQVVPGVGKFERFGGRERSIWKTADHSALDWVWYSRPV